VTDLHIGSLCSGTGALELAVAAVLPSRTAWHAEIDPDASTVLKYRFPGVPNLGDVKTLDPPPVDLLAMGLSCQPASSAGRQLVYDDPRWLWPDALRVLTTLRPPLFYFENVRNLISIRKGAVWAAILADMRTAGYAVRWLTLGACAVGAPHHRHRVFAAGAYVGPDAPPAVRVPVDECGARRIRTLPTPRAQDGVNGHNYVNNRGEPGGMAATSLLFPALLATPTAGDGAGRNEGDAAYWAKKGRSLDRAPLGAQVTLLATPTTADSEGGRTVDSRTDRSDAKKALQHQVLHVAVDLGPYAAAVARWEALRGVAAPEPTEVGPRGGRRLAGPFPEWMMGLDPGWITDVPGIDRRAALKMAGNGVCPQQGAEALRLLLAPPA
jgi:DNA (cytosine-5)-methyltransferase 1